MLNSAELSMKKVLNLWYFYFYDQMKFHAQLSRVWKKFYNLGARLHRYAGWSGPTWPHMPEDQFLHGKAYLHLDVLQYCSKGFLLQLIIK